MKICFLSKKHFRNSLHETVLTEHTEIDQMDHSLVGRKYYQMVCQVSLKNYFLKPFTFIFIDKQILFLGCNFFLSEF